jgi:RNA polymerase sigma-70 factor (ECF subfamily)
MAEKILADMDFVLPERRSAVTKETVISEDDLLLLVKKGNKEAYQTIVLRHMKSAYYIALGFLHNQQDALDVSQDAFIRAFRNRKSYDAQKPFFPWFYRILKNLCLDHIKKVKRRDEVPLDNVKVFDSRVEDEEMKRVLWKGIMELPFDHREVLILRYFRQYSYQEIAELTGKPLGTVMSSLHYAKKKLRSVIARYIGIETNGVQE